MSRSRGFAVLLLPLVWGLFASPGQAQQTSAVDFSPVIESALPATVTVAVTEGEMAPAFGFAGDEESTRALVSEAYRVGLDLSRFQGSGSGFVVRRGGRHYVVTNEHVISSAAVGGEIYVFSVDRTGYRMSLVGADTYRDVAVLAFEDPPGPEVRTIEIYSGTGLRVGSPVAAIGNPLGRHPYTVSAGIIGGLNRSLHGMTGRDGYLQTDAALIFGNSGGPLIDTAGRVIGLNTSIGLASRGSSAWSVAHLNFSLEGRYLARVVDEIIEHGRVRRSYLGALFQEGGRRGPQGEMPVFLRQIVDGSPAAAQLRDHVGAQLVAVGGESVLGAADVNSHFEEVRPGTNVRLTFRRGNQDTEVVVRTGELDDASAGALGRHIARSMLGISFEERGGAGLGRLVITNAPQSAPGNMDLYNASRPPAAGETIVLSGFYHPNGSTAWATYTLRQFTVASRLVLPTGWLGIWVAREGGYFVADVNVPPTAAL